MSEPHGPIKINANRQIALPKALTDRARLQPRDQIYVLEDDRISGALLILPVERVTEWLRLGREAEQSSVAEQEKRSERE